GALAVLLGLFAGLFFYTREQEELAFEGSDASAYETAVVTQILTDNSQSDETAENAWRGEQKLLVEITSGKYAGETFLVDNAVGILTDYGPVEVGQKVVVHISTYSDGTTMTTVYSPNREGMVYLILALFVAVTVLVGGKTGIKSILGLVLTILVLICVYLPLLGKGWSPISTAFLMCATVCVASFIILGGCSRKTLCACLGTIAGMALAMLFGILAQKLLQIDGYQAEYADALYNERITGTPFRIRGLIVAGVIISSLGAVMDVAMSISSALKELKTVNPGLTGKELWLSGMNIGRDMVGTMTNTLILAILGSSLMLILYIYSMNLSWNQFISSSFVAVEVVSSVASAVGVILAVPLTTLAGAMIYGTMGKTKKEEKL
ncbi:MAG: YibE/F family protein, partial [Oscillospiraceae bacterium]|nr:YibE/F family protein [Oscillospiraceae bacterium]